MHRADSVRHAAYALIVSGYLALTFSQAMNPLLLAVIAPLVVVSYRMRAEGNAAANARRVRIAKMLGVAMLVAAALAGATERAMLPVIAAMSTWAGLVLLFVPESERAYYSSFLVALLQLVVSGGTTDSFVFGVSILLFIVSGSLALASMTLRGDRGGLAARFGEKPGAGDGPVPVVQNGAWEAEGLLLRRLATLVTGIILTSTIVLFFVIPRYGAGYFFARDQDIQRRTGFSDRVEFGAIGAVQKSSQVALRAELTNWSGPYPGVLRWRGVGLGHFDGRSWRASEGRTFVLHDMVKGFRETSILVSPSFMSGSKALNQKIFLAQDGGFLFGATRIHRVWAKLTRVVKNAEDGLEATFPAYAPKHYTVNSDVGRPTIDSLRKVDDVYPPGVRARYTQLPESLAPAVKALAQQIVGDATTNIDRVLRIEGYLKRTYAYELPGDDAQPPEKPLEDFLFRAKKGYCEHFATALAILARTLGVPCRVVNGYAGGRYSRVGGYYMVSDSDAHSWVEVFFPHLGWLDFDATPEDAFARDDEGRSRFELYWDAALMAWRRYVIDYHLLDQIEYVRAILQFVTPRREEKPVPGKLPDLVPPRRLPPLVLFVLAVSVVLGWLVRRLTRQAHATAAARALGGAAFYERMLLVLAKRGLTRPDGQTPKEFARAVAAAWPAAAALVEELTRAYETVRFAERPVDAPAVERMLGELQKLRR